MNLIFNYKFYLFISIVSLLINGLLSLFQPHMDSEVLALIAFKLFAIAVIIAFLDELFSVRPDLTRKLKSLPRRWKR